MSVKSGQSENRNRENGSTTVEALFAVVILCMILFAMMQVYNWCMTRQICQYSAYYTSKSLALGFHPDFALRAARVAGIAISGIPNSGTDDEHAAASYMVNGDGSGVRYDYWHDDGSGPMLGVAGKYSGDEAVGMVKLYRMPLLDPAFGKLFGIEQNPEPSARVESVNYAKELLEE